MQKLLLLFFSLLTISAANATGLSGTYTIDPSGSGSTNYTSFRHATNALMKYGVSGPVVFNVADGTYHESISIYSIRGTSSTNTLTFQSASMDSTKVIVDTSGGGQTVYISSVSYVVFHQMTIDFRGLYGDVIQMSNAKHISFLNNILWFKKGGSTPAYEAVVDGDAAGNEYITADNNHIIGGYYGLEHDPGAYEFGNVISNNLIDSQEYCAINMNYQAGMRIYNNKIRMLGKNAGGIAICINYCQHHNSDSSLVFNNFVTINNGGALSMLGNSSLGIYNNSFANFYNTYTVSSYNSSADSFLFLNNAVANFGKGMAFGIMDSSGKRSDYNDLYTNGAVLCYWNGLNYRNLTAWRRVLPFDKHSVSGNPYFASAKKGDLHATKTSAILDKGAMPLASVLYDIDGQLRSLSKPDIGADEVNRDSNDVGVAAIIIPAGGTCGSSSIPVSVKVHNYGLKTQINNFNVHITVNGTLSAAVAYTDTLRPGRDTTLGITFSPVLNTSAGGAYNFQAYTDLSGDYDLTNDTSIASDSFYTVPKAMFNIAKGACMADSFGFNDSSTSAASWNWAFGDGTTSSLQSPRHLYTTVGTYTAKLVVTSVNGCQDSMTAALVVDSCYNVLSGQVTTSGSAALKNSYVYAIHYDSADTTLIPIARTRTDSNGNYSFTLKDSVVYLVAYPDSASYPHQMVTWRDTTLVFPGAKAVRMQAPSTQTVNFSTLAGANNSGTGFIGGKIVYCFICKQGGVGTPAVGIKLVLVDDKGICHGITYTDANGDFSFGKLSLQNYHVWVDRPMMDNTASPAILLSAAQNTMDKLKFTLYPTYLSENKTTAIEAMNDANSAIRIFPNPSSSFTNISYSLDKASGVKIEVYDLMGKSIATLVSATQSAGGYNIEFRPADYAVASAGIYLLKLMISDKVEVKEMIFSK